MPSSSPTHVLTRCSSAGQEDGLDHYDKGAEGGNVGMWARLARQLAGTLEAVILT